MVYQKSYIVRKFFNDKYIMLSTFSATKYPQYKENIKDKKTYFVSSVRDIYKHIKNIINRFNIGVMVAHNGQFDKEALARLGNEFACYNPFEDLDLLDTMEISQVITNSKKYVAFCKANKNIKNAMGESAFITNRYFLGIFLFHHLYHLKQYDFLDIQGYLLYKHILLVLLV